MHGHTKPAEHKFSKPLQFDFMPAASENRNVVIESIDENKAGDILVLLSENMTEQRLYFGNRITGEFELLKEEHRMGEEWISSLELHPTNPNLFLGKINTNPPTPIIVEKKRCPSRNA